MADNNQMVLAFSIIIASLIVSGSVFFAVGSLNNSLAVLARVAPNSVPTQQQAIPQPTQQQPDEQPAPTLSMKELSQNPSFTEGNPNAPVVMVEASDYQCPFCRRFYKESLANVRKEYIDTGKVFFVYKDYPLPFHPAAQPAAEATRCAGDQGKAIEMHDAIFNLQDAKGQGTVQFSVDEIKQEAQKLGLNMAAFNGCLDSKKYSKAVEENLRQGSSAGVSGTPTFFIGKANGSGKIIVGAQPYSEFKSAIDALLS